MAQESIDSERVIRVNEQDRVRLIIDAALDTFIAIDDKGVIIDWNPQAEKTFGWTRQEAIGKLLADTIVAPGLRDAHTRGLQRFLKTKEGVVLNRRLELTAIRRNGDEFPIELTILSPLIIDGRYIFNAFLRDITARKKAGDALRESESLYHSLVDNLPIYVSRKDLEGKITFVNPMLCELLGLKPEELLGKTDHDLFPAELADKYQQDDQRVAETGKTFHCIEMNRVGEDTRHMEVRKTAVRDADDKTIGVQVIFWDVSQREKALAALERSNRDLDDFVAIVSHDLHAPIRAVATYCELLQRDYHDKLDETAEEYIGHATSGVKRMQRLISDLRSYSRVTSKTKDYVSIECDAALADALANLETEIGETGAKVTHDPLPTVTADATQMMQLFQNLISNGIKYRKNPTPEIHVSAEMKEGYWQFAVSDNGIGMDLDKSKGIFRLFHRLHSDEAEFLGTGIGLATCKRIVERFGGSIWVKSEPAEGSVFFFTIPIPR